MAERVLVTGATGFVGRPLAAALAAQGFSVHAVSHHPAKVLAGEGVAVWHRADLLDAAEVAALVRDVRPGVLVHAAWFVVHGQFWTAPENGVWLDASTELAARFVEAGGRRMVGIGSCAEYATADGDDQTPWPETRTIAPTTPYGQAKAALAARLARMAQERSNFSVVWSRLFHFFGPGEHPDRLVPAIASALLDGREAAFSSGRPVRDFVSTWFVADAIAAMAAGKVTGAVNVGSGVPISILDLAVLIADIIGRRDLLRPGALPDRTGEVPCMVADTTRLRHEAGFALPAGTDTDLRRIVSVLLGRLGGPSMADSMGP